MNLIREKFHLAFYKNKRAIICRSRNRELENRMKGNDGNAGNQDGSAENQGGNVGNQGGNAGNQVGDAVNQSRNAGNQGGNAGNFIFILFIYLIHYSKSIIYTQYIGILI